MHFPARLLTSVLLAAALASPAVAQEPELLFRVTFDDLTANAQVAKGNAKSTLTRDLGLTVKEGFNKKAALLLGDGEECAFRVDAYGKFWVYRHTK